ncbi:MAG: hypothetical protein U5L06_03775 [Rhodovibrio sp.]|nr:hypothetical protein [Rhodovibrio sp.]
MGLPTAPENRRRGYSFARFQHGRIYASPDSGAFEVHGAILLRYLKLGGPLGALGLPLSDEEDVVAGQTTGGMRRVSGKVSRFEQGTIYWSSQTGAHEVTGKIREFYEDNGGPNSDLGYPTSNSEEGERRPDRLTTTSSAA